MDNANVGMGKLFNCICKNYRPLNSVLFFKMGFHNESWAGLEFSTLLTQASKCLDYRHVPHLVHS